MLNPFVNDSRIQKLKAAGKVNYAIICQESDAQFEVIGFVNRDKAYKYAVDISECGLWAYMVELTDDSVIAYLTGWCTRK
jgi:hypothetical protein